MMYEWRLLLCCAAASAAASGGAERPEEEPETEFHEPRPVVHAGPVRRLTAAPAPLPGADHELSLLVAWEASAGPPATDYSLEVAAQPAPDRDCGSLCYEYDIPGDARSWRVPARASPLAGGCAVRPGCAYAVRAVAHPWDGRAAASLLVQLDECVAGVCSCSHAGRLPAPAVQAGLVSGPGEGVELVANISWSLPPADPSALPAMLGKRAYFVSIGKQMVSDSHPSPWFAHSVTRHTDTHGPVDMGDPRTWILVPIDENSDKRSEERSGKLLDSKLLARVSLIDDRGCIGPAGNATVYDPSTVSKYRYKSTALWATLGSACVLSVIVLVAVGTRGAKRILHALRPAAAPAPLVPLPHEPTWLPWRIQPCHGYAKR